MCSNYRPANDKSVLRQHFGVTLDDAVTWAPEAFPLALAPAIWTAAPQAQGKQVFLGQFGLLPHWAKNPALAKRTYNARVETAHEKPSFKDAWRKGQRCIIPADCIYEPNWETGKAERWKISRADGVPFGIAGLWSRGWAPNGTEVLSFAMLTINADGHPLMQRFHKADAEKRMVAVLPDGHFDDWLSCPADQMHTMLARFPAEQFLGEAAPLAPRAKV